MQRDTFPLRLAPATLVAGLALCCAAHAISPEIDPDRPKPHQTPSRGAPPQSPATFDPDPNPLVLPVPAAPEFFELSRTTGAGASPFNPDPGATHAPARPKPFFDETLGELPAYGEETLPVMPPVTRRVEFVPREPALVLREWIEPLPAALQLPRDNVRANEPLPVHFHASDYPLTKKGEDIPPNSEPRTDRWRIGYGR
jgi:hypothetical protein